MHLRRFRFPFLARFLAYLDRVRMARRREHARRPRLEIGPLESREPPSDAISSLHPIGLLADIGIDPLTNQPIAEPVLPAQPSVTAPLPPQVDQKPPARPSFGSPTQPAAATPAQFPPPPTEPARLGTSPGDLSIDEPPVAPLHPAKPAASGGSGGESGGATGGGPAASSMPPMASASGESAPYEGAGDQRSDSADQQQDSASYPTSSQSSAGDDNSTLDSSPSSASESFTYSTTGSNTTAPTSGSSAASSHLPTPRWGSPDSSGSPAGPAPRSAPSAGTSSVSLALGGSLATQISPNGVALPGIVPDARGGSATRTPNSAPPTAGFYQGGDGLGQPQLPENLPDGVTIPDGVQARGPDSGGLAPSGTDTGFELSGGMSPAGGYDPGGGGGGGGPLGPSGGMPSVTPGLHRTGNYTITITQSGSNITDGFTLVETAVVDYDLSVNPSSEYTWDATVAFEYDFSRGTTTLAGTDSFTSHVEDAGTQVIVDGGIWGGVADANDANPFSFGFYNYNFGHFSISGEWSSYHWDETGYGFHNVISAGTEASLTTSGSTSTDSNFSVWSSVYNSNTFAYHLAGTHQSGQVGIGTYTLQATGDYIASAAAAGSVVTIPTTGASGDSVSASYDYESSGDGNYTVSQWGTSASAYYAVEDHGSVSSSLHTQATGTFQQVSGTSTVNGAAAYAANDSQSGTVTVVGGGSYDFGTRTGNDTVSASASQSAHFDSVLSVNYVGGGTGNYTATEAANYSHTATVVASDSYSAGGSGTSLTSSVTAQSATYTTSASGTNSNALSATFTGTTTGTESSVWGLSLTNAYAFSDQVTGREVGVSAVDVSKSNAFSESGDYWYSLSVTSTATNTSAASLGGTDSSTVTQTGFFQTSSSYSLSGTGHNSQWVAGSSTLSSADSTATLDGSGNDNDRGIAVGRFTHSNAATPTENSSSTFSYSVTNADVYSYHALGTSVRTPTTFTESETYTEGGTNTVASALSLSYSMQGTGTYLRGNNGVYSHGTSLTGGDSSNVGPGGSVALSADHEWVTYSATANGADTVSGSATFVADPIIKLEQWGYQFTDGYQFADTATGSVIDQVENAVDRSTETGNYSYSLSINSTTSVTDGNTGTDRTAVFAGGTDGYTTTETASFSSWLSASATLTSTTATAAYSGAGVDRETTIQSGEKTHAPTTADPTTWTNSYSYSGTDTDSYAYAGNSNNLSNGSLSTYYSADSVTETVDGIYSWRNGGRTIEARQTDSFTLVESGDTHGRDQTFPTYSESGTATGQYTPYSGTAWDSEGYSYSLTITPAVTAAPTSVTADFWEQGVETNTATYSGNVARGTFGDTQFHHDHETNWISGSYTTNERGTPAPDAPPGSGGTTGGTTGSSSGGSSSSSSSSSSTPSTFTFTAHGTGQLLTVRTDDELWLGATSATPATSSMSVALTGDGDNQSTLIESFKAGQNWSAPFTNGPPTVTNSGAFSGTKSRTVTEGNSYSLSASQVYQVSGTLIVGGTDTYSLHEVSSNAVHENFTGTEFATAPPVLFNGTADGTLGPGSYTGTLVDTEDAGYTADRIAVAGYSWAAGQPVGVSVDAVSHVGSFANSQSMSVANTGVVTVDAQTRSPNMGTVVTTNQETVTGTLAVSTTYTATQTGSYGGTYTPVVSATSAHAAWGTGAVTLHTDGYKTISMSPSHTMTLAAIADKNLTDTHSSTWSWAKGAGGSASSTGTNTMTGNYWLKSVNREETVGVTYSTTMVSTSHDETATDERRTYTVPVTLSTSTGAANQDMVVATFVATGFETSSVTGTNTHFNDVQHGFETHHEFASQSYTAVSTETPLFTQSARWVAGVDDHHASANHTFDNVSTIAANDDQDTVTHTISQYLVEHHSIGTNPTQDSIDSRDYQSLSISHSATVTSDEQSTWSTFSHLYTASLSEIGPGTNITSTLAASDSFTMQAHGSLYQTSVDAWFHETANASDTDRVIKTPIGGGATRTLDTSHHVSSNYYDVFYLPNGGSPRYTHSTTMADHLVTLQQVGTLTESLVGDYTDDLKFNSNKWTSSFHHAYHTSGSLDQNGQWHGTSIESSFYDSSRELQDNGIDPAWMAGVGAFVEGLLDVILAGPSMLYMFIKHPCDPLTFLERLGEGALDASVGLANSLVALATGKDPETGRKLSDKEYAEVVGGLLGMIVGMIVMEFATRAAGAVFKMGRVVNGARPPKGRFILDGPIGKKPPSPVNRGGPPPFNPHGRPLERLGGQARRFIDTSGTLADPRTRAGYDPGEMHLDHPVAEVFGGTATRPTPAGMNLRKGGLEGELRKYEDYLIRNGMSPNDARAVIQSEIDSLARDVVAAPFSKVSRRGFRFHGH